MFNKGQILSLNKNYFPIGVTSLERALIKFFSGGAFLLDISYQEKSEGYDFGTIESFEAVRTWKNWASLPIRECDKILKTSSGLVRRPTVIVCAKYNKVRFHRVQFPCKRNIWRRDDYTCGYTLKRLTKDELSIDHIIPRSKGGGDTWENLITCDKKVNNMKGDKLPEEAGLRLRLTPKKPKGGLIFENVRKEWEALVDV